jgi:hypothetical protein
VNTFSSLAAFNFASLPLMRADSQINISGEIFLIRQFKSHLKFNLCAARAGDFRGEAIKVLTRDDGSVIGWLRGRSHRQVGEKRVGGLSLAQVE